jgi:hypothetical protein
MRRFGILFFLLAALTASATTYNSDGTPANINTLIAGAASSGDTVTVPAGSYTWATAILLNKAVTLQGAGIGSTIITVNAAAIVVVSGGTGARVTGFQFNGAASIDSIVTCITANGWRVDHCYFNDGASTGRSILADHNGLIDHCTFNSPDITEHIWTTAPGGTADHTSQDNVWATATDMGSSDAIFVEDCTFNGNGYVSDFGYASRAVVRFCTMNGTNQIDSHGPETNYRGNRQTEAYGNHWTYTAPYWQAFNIRAGALIAFDNTSDITSNDVWFWIQHYGPEDNIYGAAYAPFLYYNWHTPYEWPLWDQVGIGKDPGKVGGNDPAYVFHNTQNSAEWPITYGPGGSIADKNGTTNTAGYAIGATSITLTALTGNLYAGNIVKFAGDTNYYTVGAERDGAGVLTLSAPGLLKAIPASATTLTTGPFTKYDYQLGSTGHTFTMQDIIKEDRDIFLYKTSFTGASGVGRGTKATMNAITPSTTGVGFWVTNEGNWNTTLPANTSGQLYTWSGSAWVLHYTPYTYPYPTGAYSSALSGNVLLSGNASIK